MLPAQQRPSRSKYPNPRPLWAMVMEAILAALMASNPSLRWYAQYLKSIGTSGAAPPGLDTVAGGIQSGAISRARSSMSNKAASNEEVLGTEEYTAAKSELGDLAHAKIAECLPSQHKTMMMGEPDWKTGFTLVMHTIGPNSPVYQVETNRIISQIAYSGEAREYGACVDSVVACLSEGHFAKQLPYWVTELEKSVPLSYAATRQLLRDGQRNGMTATKWQQIIDTLSDEEAAHLAASQETAHAHAALADQRRAAPRGQNKRAPKRQAPKPGKASKDPKQSKVDPATAVCFTCNEVGHFARNCPLKLGAAETGPSQVVNPVGATHPALGPQPSVRPAAARNPPAHGEFPPHWSSFALSATTAEQSDRGWIVDCGATRHIVSDVSLLSGIRLCRKPKTVTFGNGGKCVANLMGEVCIELPGGHKLLLHDVLYCPGATVNLLSVRQVARLGLRFALDADSWSLWDDGEMLASAACRKDSLYGWDGHGLYSRDSNAFAYQARVQNPVGLLHARCGHISLRELGRLLKDDMADVGLHVTAEDCKQAESTEHPCDVCMQAKHTHISHPPSSSRCEVPLGVVHSDVMGPFPRSRYGKLYLLTALDEATGYVAVKALASKAEVAVSLIHFLTWLERQTGQKVKRLRTDNGTEYVNHTLTDYVQTSGIEHVRSVPHTPQQNGIAERLNRTLHEKARALRAGSPTPIGMGFWPELYETAAFLRNKLPTSHRPKTPHEMLLGEKPDISFLRVFGSKVHAKIPAHLLTSKLSPRSEPGVLVGFVSHPRNVYKVLLKSGEVRPLCDVIFSEPDGDFSHTPADKAAPHVSSGPQGAEILGGAVGAAPQVREAVGASGVSAMDRGDRELAFQQALHDFRRMWGCRAESAELSQQEAGTGPSVAQAARPLPAPNTRPRRQGRRIGEYEEVPEMEDEEYVTVAEVTDAVGSTKDFTVPKSHEEAMSLPEREYWLEAEREELLSLYANSTYSLGELPPGMRALPVKWVYALKRDHTGRVIRFKARLVVKGFRQVHGRDFDQVFAPVGKYTTLRLLLGLVAQEGYDLHQIDVKTAFLHGNLEEEIWVQQPMGYEEGGPRMACHLHKALYGLKQAPRQWYKELSRVLGLMGLRPSTADSGLFVQDESHRYEGCVYILVYVDDMLIAARNTEDIMAVKAGLREYGCFELHDLEEPKLFLNWEIVRDRKERKISISQTKAVKALLAHFQMDDCKPYARPLNTMSDLLEGDLSPLDQERYTYRELVGSLNYLAVCTRPDLAQAVGALSRFCSDPKAAHWRAARGVLHYLKGTQDHKLVYGAGISGVIGYTDADFAGDKVDYKSTSGYVFTFNGGAVSWLSKRQDTVAVSTTEAEYMACFTAAKEAVALRQVLSALNVEWAPMPIYSDSQSAMAIAANPVQSQRAKHIAVKYHYVREKVAMKDVTLTYLKTDQMLADMFTKPVPTQKLHLCCAGIGFLSSASA